MYPLNHPPEDLPEDTIPPRDAVPCGRDPRGILNHLLSFRPNKFVNWKSEYPMPYNLLLNTVKHGVETEYSMIIGS